MYQKKGLFGFKSDLKQCKTQQSLLSTEVWIWVFFAPLWKTSFKISRKLNQYNFLLEISSNSDRSYTIQYSYLNNMPNLLNVKIILRLEYWNTLC